jgi:hypothetical protein
MKNLIIIIIIFWDRISLCSPDWPQAEEPPALASQVLGLQICVTTPSPLIYLNSNYCIFIGKALGSVETQKKINVFSMQSISRNILSWASLQSFVVGKIWLILFDEPSKAQRGQEICLSWNAAERNLISIPSYTKFLENQIFVKFPLFF